MNNPPAPHDSRDAIFRVLEEFASKNRPVYPQWRIELYFYERSGDIMFFCERPCCDGGCVVVDGKSLQVVVDDESRHCLRLGCCVLFPSDSDTGFTLSFGGMTEFHPRAIENSPCAVVPAGATVEDAIAAIQEVLDLVPVCIQVLEADDRHLDERDDFRSSYERLPTPNPIEQLLASADPSGHRTSSLMGMLNLSYGQGSEAGADLSFEHSFAKVRCSGCGYLRFRESRVWDSGKAVVGNHGDDVTELRDALGGSSFRSMDCTWSQRVVDAVEDAGFTGAKFHRIRHIVSRMSGREFFEFQPYYAVEFTGRVKIDRQLYDGGDGFLCPECGVWKPRLEGTVRWENKCLAVVDEGANMPDFALAENISCYYPFISARAARLFAKLGFTGFAYKSLVGFYSFDNKVGDPLNPGWWEEYTKKVTSILPAGFTQ